jgi:hypothetical protein
MFLPEGMEDKWLVLHDDGTMNFYRSWTGFHVYSLTFEPDGDDGSNVPIDAWASRDPDVWTVTPDDERDAQVLRWLVRTLVLRQSIPFPHDPRLSPADAALAAWSCAGNASLGILPGDPPPEPRARDARPPPSPRRRKRR